MSNITNDKKLMPCPFCGNHVLVTNGIASLVECSVCEYSSMACKTQDGAITVHNSVCRAVEAAKKGEAK